MILGAQPHRLARPQGSLTSTSSGSISAALRLQGQHCSLRGRVPLQHSSLQTPQTRHHLGTRASPCVASATAAAVPMPEEGSHSSSDYGGYNSAQQRGFPEWLATVRAIAFYVTTFAFATPLFTLMLVIYPLVLAFDKHRRRAEHFINNIWAKLTTLFYYPIKFEGLDNLPAANQPAVYVANHLSFLDIYTLFHLNRDFKFISKTSNFLIPVIGWSMFLTGHVMINRVDRKSQIECLKQCGELLKRGASVLFFPEGTRSKDGKMQPFKKGAFSVAAKAKVPVVPITLVGTGDLMPNNREYLLFPGKVKVVVHPAVQPASADVMMNQAAAAIASSLPLHLRLAEETAAATAGSNGAALPPPATAAAATAAASEAGLTPAAWEDGKQPEAAPAVAASDKE